MVTSDIIVIGGGPAGVTAALRARELGATVALVERERMGGTCTNDGCVPTRVLAKAARLLRDSEQFADYGLEGSGRPVVNLPQLLARTKQIVEQVHEKKQLLSHLEEVGVTVRAGAGAARFVDPHTIAIGEGSAERMLRGQKIVICAGGHARRPPFPGSEFALTYTAIWNLPRLPRSVVVVGGAATGCQLASIMAAFGVPEVTLLDSASRILPGEDVLISDIVTRGFRRHGVKVVTGIGGVSGIEKAGGDIPELLVRYKISAHSDDEEILTTEAVVLAIGWPGNIEALDLDAAGVKTERGYVTVNDSLQTSTPHIFAAGDITGRMMLVQSAGDEARTAAENAVLGTDKQEFHTVVPHGGFTDPEYASVGLTEEKSRERESDAVSTIVPYADLDRAVIDGRPEGACKLIVSRTTHQILGAHVAGEQALEVIEIIAAGMATEMKIEQLADLELAYPTFTAIVGIAAREICRELGTVPVSPHWRAVRPPRAAEWEHSYFES
ncbi:MAG: NAD(P)/FAD-dependent oxidoreductase [Cytophagales bacterium]|nr:NAD(P)/FAD-dependent oxidoreductase [Armatimonadota bacterium]